MINRSGGLIEDHNWTASKNSACKSDQLALTLTEVLTASFDMSVKGPSMPAAEPLQDVSALLIGELLRGIKVKTDTTGEKNGVLGDECNPCAECLCVHIGNVDAVDHDAAGFRSNNTEKGYGQCRFTAARSADDSGSRPAGNLEGDIFQSWIEMWGISKGDILKDDVATIRWPSRWRIDRASWFFLRCKSSSMRSTDTKSICN